MFGIRAIRIVFDEFLPEAKGSDLVFTMVEIISANEGQNLIMTNSAHHQPQRTASDIKFVTPSPRPLYRKKVQQQIDKTVFMNYMIEIKIRFLFLAVVSS